MRSDEIGNHAGFWFQCRKVCGFEPHLRSLLCGVKGKIIGRGKIVLKLKVWGMDLIPRQVTEICGCRQMEKARVYEARTLGSNPSSRVMPP